MRGLLLLSLTITLSTTTAHTEIYRYIDEQGNTVYSDKASENSETLSLPAINTTPSLDIKKSKPKQKPNKNLTADDNRVRIRSPQNNAIIANGLTATTVEVSTDEPLQQDQKIRISVDGNTTITDTTTRLSIPQLPRGPHQITATIINAEGKIVSSDQINVMVYRPTN
ncbi:Uncharacterised protein [Zhongshania aliphaticivorans]|uniref:DUF4124 domain-containing protein n=1 Tax=Zhongshania aliphaticivorans TaxID=1470434 RepID=A0A5S9MTC4_9GAMM|nr:DUF4124 domain-containing protein [Zhongshania aliphaticivorans]CAA0078658.1 Uncharacterised protein [Zhongshania aliphaticivorans]CAA0086580.1 Uncharacterised protein [Zhongshania aliphaticivorans]